MSTSDKFEGFKDKASGKFDELKQKAERLKDEAKRQAAAQREESAHDPTGGPIDKAADFINDKTGGSYSAKINSVADKIKDMTGRGGQSR